jgi:hypothetical protein
MDGLLARVIDAHGGLDRWSEVNRVTARLTIGGHFWVGRLKGSAQHLVELRRV